MPRRIYKPEEIIAKLRQVEVLTSQGKSAVDAIRCRKRLAVRNRLHRSLFEEC